VKITSITPLATTAPLRLRAGLSRSYSGDTTDRPSGGGKALPWKLGTLASCGHREVPTLMSVGVEVTRLTAAPATVKGLVVHYRDSRGGEHLVKTTHWRYTVHS